MVLPFPSQVVDLVERRVLLDNSDSVVRLLLVSINLVENCVKVVLLGRSGYPGFVYGS